MWVTRALGKRGVWSSCCSADFPILLFRVTSEGKQSLLRTAGLTGAEEGWSVLFPLHLHGARPFFLGV